ncbi:MAG: hypothetical protein V5B30_05300 [Candidatus Accumulibacter delftensis]
MVARSLQPADFVEDAGTCQCGQLFLDTAIGSIDGQQIFDVLGKSTEIGIDEADRVVELVRNTRRELADRRHLFRLQELQMSVFELAVEFDHFGEAAGQGGLCPCPLDDAPDCVGDHLHRLDIQVVVGSNPVADANDHAHCAVLDDRHRDQPLQRRMPVRQAALGRVRGVIVEAQRTLLAATIGPDSGLADRIVAGKHCAAALERAAGPGRQLDALLIVVYEVQEADVAGGQFFDQSRVRKRETPSPAACRRCSLISSSALRPLFQAAASASHRAQCRQAARGRRPAGW